MHTSLSDQVTYQGSRSERLPAEIMNPYYQNQSCDPFSPTSLSCTLGNYVVYSVNVSSAQDAIAGIKFARDNNIRLVIKNTGHEYVSSPIRSVTIGLIMLPS